jgi:hypothetical protein
MTWQPFFVQRIGGPENTLGANLLAVKAALISKEGLTKSK